jgi:hypothetical protein
MAENYSVVDFSGLSATSDGNTLLYADNKVCKSDKTLGQLIDGKIDDKGYASETFVTGEINELSGTVSTEYATKEELGKVGNFIITDGDEEGPELDAEEAQTKSIYLIENGSGKDKYREWIATGEVGSKTWTCIGDTTMDLSEYAKSADVNTGLALKEDKVFVVEYGVTTYAAIKDAYDAGKQIVCHIYPNKAVLPDYVWKLNLTEYVPMANLFIFAAQIGAKEFKYAIVNNNDEWNEEQHNFQDTLTFVGENNIITAINTSAIGVPTIIPTATQPADTTACSMYVDVNGKFYIVTANS